MAQRTPVSLGQGIALIATVYALLALVLWPAYNWPVIDSWAFGYTVKQWLEQGQFVVVDWGSMSLLAHVVWGALFSLPAGFSFGAVNLSTFVLSFVAATATYLTLRELDAEGEAGIASALAGAGVLIVNPAVVQLSYSYMTDISFLAWYTLSAWCDLRGLRRRDNRWLLLGSLFATLAVLTRQNGIVLPAALCAYLLWQWLRKRRSFPLAEGLASAVLPVLALAVYTSLSRLGLLPSRTNALQWLQLSPSTLVADAFRILMYMGLFLLPLTLAVAAGAARSGGWRRLRQWIALAALTALAGAGAVIQYLRPFKLPYLGTWRIMPYFPAVWTIFGSGSQEEWLAGTREMLFGYRFWIVITALSCAGAALLVWTLLRQALTPGPSPITWERGEGRMWTSPSSSIARERGEGPTSPSSLIAQERGESPTAPFSPIARERGEGPTSHSSPIAQEREKGSAAPSSPIARERGEGLTTSPSPMTPERAEGPALPPSPILGRGAGGEGWPTGFIVLMGAAYLLPLLVYSGEIYERYLIPLILPAAALILRAARRQRIRLWLPAFAVPAIVFLAFSLALTAELIAWNGAAWNAASRLAARGIPLEQIDGGFCWNGWHFADQIGKTAAAPEPGAPAYMELTPQIRRTYVVSFSPLAGYETLASEPYWSPLRWGKASLLILHRR